MTSVVSGQLSVVSTPTPTPELLIACAREYLDTPWRHQGRLRGVGVDCVGLLVGVANDAGLGIAEVPADYSTVPQAGWMLGELEQRLKRVELHDVQPGDAVAFAWSLHPWHCGLVTRVEVRECTRAAPFAHLARGPTWLNVTIIDAYRRGGKVLERQLDTAWLSALHSAWRWPGFMSAGAATNTTPAAFAATPPRERRGEVGHG